MRHFWEKAGHLLPVFMGVSPILTCLAGGGWVWAPFLFFFLCVPWLDHFLGERRRAFSPPEEEERRKDISWRLALWAFLPAQWATLVFSHAVLAWEGLPLWMAVGFALSSAIAIAVGANVAHELGHHPSRVDRLFAIAMLTPVFMGDFYLYHNFGHHVLVATPQDPGSARLGESFWAFWRRSVIGKTLLAARLEEDRLLARGKRVLSFQNRFLLFHGASFLLLLAFTAIFGWIAVLLFSLQWLMTRTMLAGADYVEHYGMARKTLADGQAEPFSISHAWNSDHALSNFFLANVNRHSQHHENEGRPYQILETPQEAPRLPSGYMAMIALAFVPPLFFRVMHPKLQALYDAGLCVPNKGWLEGGDALASSAP